MDHIADWLKVAVSVIGGVIGAWIASIVGLFRVSNAVHTELSDIKVHFANIETKFAEIDTAFAQQDGAMEKALTASRHRTMNDVQVQFSGPLTDEVRREYSQMREDIRALATSVMKLSQDVAVLLDRDKRQ